MAVMIQREVQTRKGAARGRWEIMNRGETVTGRYGNMKVRGRLSYH